MLKWLLSFLTGGSSSLVMYLAGGLVIAGAQANSEAVRMAVEQQKKYDAISTAFEIMALKKEHENNVRTVTITKTIPKYITVETDRRFPLPFGFCVLHDQAAAGADTKDVPKTAAVPDDRPCEVTVSQAVGVIVANYGQYYEVANRLQGLQTWLITEMAAQGNN